jgi:hypothetical protein
VVHFESIFVELLGVARDFLLKDVSEPMSESVVNLAASSQEPNMLESEKVEEIGYTVQKEGKHFKDPWILPSLEISQEESELPDPATFRGLSFMEMPVEEAQAEFKAKVSSRVDPGFAASTRVLQLLLDFMSVFVPTEWKGITGIAPLKFQLKPGMPDRIKPKRVYVQRKYQQAMEAELMRLKKYHLRPSTSPYASSLVVAPKATHPFVRLCGDYRVINKWLLCPHQPIPEVRKELDKIDGHKIFCDLDMSNAFHNLLLHGETSALLSIQCPREQLEPVFLPEGVSPASGALMTVVNDIFHDCQDFMIVIFDNFLILAYDYDDAYMKLERVLTRCRERNIFLKLSKC